MASEVVKVRLNIFGRFRKSSGNPRKSSEVAGTISEIPSMTRQKSLKSQSHLTRKKLAGILQTAPWLKIGMYCDTFMVWRVPLYSCFHYWFTCEKPATFLDRGRSPSLFLGKLFPRKMTVVAWTFSQSVVSKMISISLSVNYALSPMK